MKSYLLLLLCCVILFLVAIRFVFDSPQIKTFQTDLHGAGKKRTTFDLIANFIDQRQMLHLLPTPRTPFALLSGVLSSTTLLDAYRLMSTPAARSASTCAATHLYVRAMPCERAGRGGGGGRKSMVTRAPIHASSTTHHPSTRLSAPTSARDERRRCCCCDRARLADRVRDAADRRAHDHVNARHTDTDN
jgi:hypothetical protein